METDTKKTEMTLEETFARLDAITAALEDPSTGLEASFALYKEGSELLKQAGGKIDLVQKQVQVLQQADRLGKIVSRNDMQRNTCPDRRVYIKHGQIKIERSLICHPVIFSDVKGLRHPVGKINHGAVRNRDALRISGRT